MTTWRRGDVVLVPVGFADRSGTKRRPAVIVSGDRYHDKSSDVLIASITSNLDAVQHPGDQLLQDWGEAGPLRPSLAQTKIAARLIGRRLGSLTARDRSALDHGLRQALDLP